MTSMKTIYLIVTVSMILLYRNGQKDLSNEPPTFNSLQLQAQSDAPYATGRLRIRRSLIIHPSVFPIPSDSPPPPRLKLAFLKTHKTGSRTLANTLARVAFFRNATVFSPCHLLSLCDDQLAEQVHEPGQYDFVLNHIKDPNVPLRNETLSELLEIFRRLLGPEYSLVTTIRDPIDRIRSYARFYEVDDAKMDIFGLDWDLGVFQDRAEQALFQSLLESRRLTPVVLERLYESLALLSFRLGLPAELFVPYNHEGQSWSAGSSALQDMPPTAQLTHIDFARERSLYGRALRAVEHAPELQDPATATELTRRAYVLRVLARSLQGRCGGASPMMSGMYGAHAYHETQRHIASGVLPADPLCALVSMNDLQFESFFVETGRADRGATCGEGCRENEHRILARSLLPAEPALASGLPSLQRMLDEYKAFSGLVGDGIGWRAV